MRSSLSRTQVSSSIRGISRQTLSSNSGSKKSSKMMCLNGLAFSHDARRLSTSSGNRSLSLNTEAIPAFFTGDITFTVTKAWAWAEIWGPYYHTLQRPVGWAKDVEYAIGVMETLPGNPSVNSWCPKEDSNLQGREATRT